MRTLIISISITILTLLAQSMKAQDAGMEQNIFQTMKGNDKAAVVAVHHGTTDAAEQPKLDALNRELHALYPTADFKEAWMSRSAIKERSRKNASIMPTLDELLVKLQKDGYTHILIQPSHMTNDIEMQYARILADNASKVFKQVRLGMPLLHSEDDYSEMASLTAAAYGVEKMANVLLCGGDEDIVNAEYAVLENRLRMMNLKNWYVVSTVEHQPEDLQALLKSNKQKKVNIIPFTFIADDDISLNVAREWASKLNKAGFKAITPASTNADFDKRVIALFKKHIKDAENVHYYNAKEMMMQRR